MDGEFEHFEKLVEEKNNVSEVETKTEQSMMPISRFH
jgi:hypothetical protein